MRDRHPAGGHEVATTSGTRNNGARPASQPARRRLPRNAPPEPRTKGAQRPAHRALMVRPVRRVPPGLLVVYHPHHLQPCGFRALVQIALERGPLLHGERCVDGTVVLHHLVVHGLHLVRELLSLGFRSPIGLSLVALDHRWQLGIDGDVRGDRLSHARLELQGRSHQRRARR